jgi:hypothetical protein
LTYRLALALANFGKRPKGVGGDFMAERPVLFGNRRSPNSLRKLKLDDSGRSLVAADGFPRAAGRNIAGCDKPVAKSGFACPWFQMQLLLTLLFFLLKLYVFLDHLAVQSYRNGVSVGFC